MYQLSSAVFVFVVCMMSTTCASHGVKFMNPVLHMDIHGQPMDAHDGNVVQYSAGGLYYFYGMGYTNCTEESSGCAEVKVGACGFRLDHTIGLWSSPDLSQGSWTPVSANVLPVGSRPSGIYYRPKVVFNSNTNLYVLWVNLVPQGNFGLSAYVVATSPTPAGPFDIKNSSVALKNPAGGDFNILVDDDDTAYIVYTSVTDNHSISVERLSKDYLSSAYPGDPTANSGTLPQGAGCEAPAAFKRNGTYYYTFGHTCCFCEAGAGVRVVTAPAPLGPFTYRGNIGLTSTGGSITHTQQNDIFTVSTTTNGTIHMWTGDQWQSAADHIKSHDMQVWWPLDFDADGMPATLEYPANFVLEMPY